MNDDVVELVQRCLAGDEGAWSEFVERFQQPVFGLCIRMLRHRQDAEDVAQDSLVRAMRHLGQWDPSRAMLPWLLTIAANRCRTTLKRRTERPAPAELVWEPTANSADLNRGDLAEEVDRALAELRDDYRICFILFHQNELNCQEISEVLDCPTGTVKTWLHRARHQLAERLRRRGVWQGTEHELRSISSSS